MKFQRAILFAIIAVSYDFLYKSVATVVPSVFRNLPVVVACGILSLVAAIGILMFFVAFHRYYARQKSEKTAATFGIVGGAGLLLAQSITLLSVIIPSLRLEIFDSLKLSILVVSSIAILLFFATLYREAARSERYIPLLGATRLAIIGSVASATLLIVVNVNYFTGGAIAGFLHSRLYIVVLSFGLLAFSVFSMVYFLAALSKVVRGFEDI